MNKPTQKQIDDSKKYVLKRVQAQQNSRSRINKVLLAAALQLANGKQEGEITNSIYSQINDIAYGYAKTSLSFRDYEDGEKDIKSYMEDVQYGQTFYQRNKTYSKRYVKDMTVLLIACSELEYSKNKIISEIHNSYLDPLNSSVIGAAVKNKQYHFTMPNYGVGRTNVASTAIFNNVENTIAMSYSEIDHNFATFNGSIGFYVYRGSSYPCAECQSHTGKFHNMNDEYPPYHGHCVCYTVYIYK